MSKSFVTLVAVLALVSSASANLTINPATTLAAETGNNTSAASTFVATTNGDAGAGNISKLSTRNLLYPGSTSKIYTHLMAWFGGTNHMNVGYTSADPKQVHKQVDDMMSRGIQGAIIDWYGTGSNHAGENQTAIYMMQDAETRGGQFEFAIVEDSGALKSCAATTGCSVTQSLINDLNYVATEFEPSPAYMRTNGRPVIFFFLNSSYTIDWNLVRSSVQGNPLFIFRNSGGFTQLQSNGSFSWVGLSSDPTNMGLSYLDNFDATALTYPAEYPFASSYKGFNDTLASWGQNRILNQNCGQTWLATMAESGKYYSAAKQLDSIQLVTWNDYEEGSEIETGISNCVSVAASVAGTSLNWTVAGQENTVDHYTVFISSDGQNLMALADVATGVGTLDLRSFALSPGQYILYVKAVGKPGLTNKMSSAVALTVAPTVGVQDFAIAVASSTVGVNTYTTQVTPTSAGFFNNVQFSCAGLPANYSCSFAPASVMPGTSVATSTLTIAKVQAARNRSPLPGPFAPYGSGAAFAIAAITLCEDRLRRRKLRPASGIALLFMLACLLAFAGCGGKAAPSATTSASLTPPSSLSTGNTATVMVTGTSGNVSHSASISFSF